MTSKLLLAAFSASLLLGAAHGAMAADAAKPAPVKITPAVLKPLQAAQAAYNKKDFPAALAAIQVALAVPDRTPGDNYQIHHYAMYVHIGMQDIPGATTEAEAALDPDPSAVPDGERAATYKTALQLANSQKHNDKALAYAKVLQAMTPPPDAETQSQIASALYRAGDFDGVIAIAQKNIDAAKAAGKPPAKSDLNNIKNAQVNKKDEVGAEVTLEILVATYGEQQDWDELSRVALTARQMRDIDYVYMGRLIVAQSGKVKSDDAIMVGSAANSNKLALYGDAEAMQKFGGPAPDPRAAADRKSLPKQIADGAKNNGEYNVKTAEAAFGYGQYADAEKLARDAKTKPGVKDPTEPDMVIAMSLSAQGKYAEAAAIFDTIKPANPASARVVRLWTYYVKTKANPATAAAK
jgi:tetratricopeptide (TPR) repeat protein